MKIKLSLIFILAFVIQSYAQERLLFFQTGWGNHLSWAAFCERAKTSGYDGIDIWLPSNSKSQEELKKALDKYDLLLNLMHGSNKDLSFEESLNDYTEKLKVLIQWKPVLINCHTGSDFYTEAQNKAYIDVANTLSAKHNIPIYHETHRSRFSYSLPETQKYLTLIPDLKLTLDISHWMVVHESLLRGKEKQLEEVIKRTKHIHARVGHAEGPQVNDPEAPEWKNALNRHMDIWEDVIMREWEENQGIFTITTEFGPAGYLPTLPYTRIPVADQWKANVFIMHALKQRLGLE